MSVTALVSPKGGVGKTTIVANLAAAIAAGGAGGRTLAVDMDPQNALRLHHGIDTRNRDGIGPAAVEGRPLVDVVRRGGYGVDVLPYGHLDEHGRQRFESMLAEDPDWLARQLRPLDWAHVLIDTPPGPTVYMRQAVRAADVLLIALLADAASFATAVSVDDYIDEYCGASHRPRSIYVANQTDSMKTLNRDVLSVMDRVLRAEEAEPWHIHYDASVEEALACGQPIITYEPDGAATRDLEGLAEWLTRSA